MSFFCRTANSTTVLAARRSAGSGRLLGCAAPQRRQKMQRASALVLLEVLIVAPADDAVEQHDALAALCLVERLPEEPSPALAAARVPCR